MMRGSRNQRQHWGMAGRTHSRGAHTQRPLFHKQGGSAMMAVTTNKAIMAVMTNKAMTDKAMIAVMTNKVMMAVLTNKALV